MWKENPTFSSHTVLLIGDTKDVSRGLSLAVSISKSPSINDYALKRFSLKAARVMRAVRDQKFFTTPAIEKLGEVFCPQMSWRSKTELIYITVAHIFADTARGASFGFYICFWILCADQLLLSIIHSTLVHPQRKATISECEWSSVAP